MGVTFKAFPGSRSASVGGQNPVVVKQRKGRLGPSSAQAVHRTIGRYTPG
jgi:hypothetical protein